MVEYTIEFKDATLSGQALSEVITAMTSPDFTATFGQYFSAKWNIYELYTTDTQEWYDRFRDKYTLLAKKYKEKVSAYQTEIDVLDGKKVTTTYDTQDTSHAHDVYEGESTMEDTNYGLPNKSVQSPKGYPTEIADNTTGSQSDITTDTNKSKEGTVTITGRENTADLRENYINKVRDIIAEFVNEFSNLFITIY